MDVSYELRHLGKNQRSKSIFGSGAGRIQEGKNLPPPPHTQKEVNWVEGQYNTPIFCPDHKKNKIWVLFINTPLFCMTQENLIKECQPYIDIYW